MEYHFLGTMKMSLSVKCWKWVVAFMQFLFRASPPSPPPPRPPQQPLLELSPRPPQQPSIELSPPTRPPVELCDDILFDIFLRLPPQVIPRFSCINKQSNDIIDSPLFQTRYWNQKLHLPRLSAIVYYQQKLNHRIGFALTIKEYGQRLDKGEFHKYRQVPEFGFQPSSYTRLLQWAESMLQYHEKGPNGVNIQKHITSQSHRDSKY